MKVKQVSLSLLIALSLVVAPFSSAFAQNDEEVLAGNLYSTTTTSTTTAAIAGGVILTVLLVGGGNRGAEEVAVYLEQNAVAVQHDLYVGGGETARDLAAIFQVEDRHLHHFANLLFEHRNELASLAEPGAMNETRALQFTELIVAGMLRDKALVGSARQILG